MLTAFSLSLTVSLLNIDFLQNALLGTFLIQKKACGWG